MPYLYPPAVVQILIANGVPAVAGYVEAYFANTSVPASLFDSEGTELPWPVVADSNGQVSYCLNVGTTYDLRAYDADGALLWEADDVNASPAGTITTSYEVLTDGTDPMPAYLGLKLTEGNNITITPVLGGPNGTVLEIASTGGGGSAQWETVSIGGADYLTPVAGLPQLIKGLIFQADSEIRAGASTGVSGNFTSVTGNQVTGFNQASGGNYAIAIDDSGLTTLLTTGAFSVEAPTGSYIKSDVGGIVSDTQGRIVNAGNEITLSVTDYDGGGVPTLVGNLVINGTATTLGNSGKFVTVDSDGVKISASAGVDYTTVLSINQITGAVQAGTITASGIGAVPYTGASSDVNLGAHKLTVQEVVYSGTPSTPVAGSVWYDTATNTLCVKSDIAGQTLNVGQEEIVRVVNISGSPILNGKVVYVSGAFNAFPQINLADNTSATIDNVIGVVTADIADSAEGYVTTSGVVRDINTSAFNVGDRLYVGTAGGFTATKPTGTAAVQPIGYVLTKNATTGSILVYPQSPSHLADLHDVNTADPSTAGQVLISNGGYWTALAPAAGWLHNTDLGVVGYSTPTAADVGADPAGTAAGLVAGYLPLTGGTLTGPLQVNPSSTTNTPFGSQNTGAGLLSHLRASNTASTDIGRITYSAYDSANNSTAYARTRAHLVSNTDTSENGAYFIDVMRGGTLRETLGVKSTAGVSTLTLGYDASDLVTAPNLAGTGTRFATASSTGLLGAVDLFGTANTWTATQTTRNIEPDGNGTRMLGSATNWWSTAYIQNNVALAFYIGSGGAVGVSRLYQSATNEFIWDDGVTTGASFGRLRIGGALAPYANNSKALGETGLRWSNVYTQLLNVAGTATMAGVSCTSVTSSGAVSGTTITASSTVTSAGRKGAVSEKTADYTLTATDEVVVLSGTTGRTFTLPDASGSGQRFTMCNECTGGALLTIALNTGDSVNGSTASFTIPQNQSVTVCDYANEKWVIL